ncbi:hypothetical protein ACQ5SK_00660 [Bradyrhizobium japonicum]
MRLTIAFQFQSVAAVAPLLQQTFAVGLADIGILIGLYFTPASCWRCRAARSAGPLATSRRRSQRCC